MDDELAEFLRQQRPRPFSEPPREAELSGGADKKPYKCQFETEEDAMYFIVAPIGAGHASTQLYFMRQTPVSIDSLEIKGYKESTFIQSVFSWLTRRVEEIQALAG